MSWQTDLNRGHRTDKWTASKAARQGAAWVSQTATWLRGEQAALMRYVPEQDNALRWYAATNPGTAAPEISDLMPQWLDAFHGLDCSQWPIVTGATDGLSPTAQLMQHLCSRRADQMKAGDIVVCSPMVMKALAVLIQTSRYQFASDLAAHGLPGKTGTLLLPSALTRGGPTGIPDAPDTQPFRAVTWAVEQAPDRLQVRCLDWADISGDHASTGDPRIDAQVREQLDRAGTQLPPLMFNGEWVTTGASPAADSVDTARTHIVSALRESRTHDIDWEPQSVLSESPSPVAVRIVAALADALEAGLFTAGSVAVPTPGARQEPGLAPTTSVIVLDEPAD